MTNSSLKQRRQLFPDKLWDLVNNQPSSGIQWSKSGKKIEIDRGQLEKFLQTRLIDRNTTTTCHGGPTSSPNSSQSSTKFRSNNFDSFIRQLHFYGFKKSGNSYHHEKFQRDRPEVLCTMKRKYSSMPQPNNGGNQTISTILARSGSGEQLAAKQEDPTSMDTEQTPSSATASSSLPSPTSSLSSASSKTTIPTPAPSSKKQSPKGVRHTDTIKMYTIDSVGMQDGNLSFSNVRETSVKAVRDNKSVKISIPDLMLNNHSDDSWPKTLVLENQNILSAYFIYKLN